MRVEVQVGPEKTADALFGLYRDNGDSAVPSVNHEDIWVKMRLSALMAALFSMSILVVFPASGSEYLHINDVTMRLEGANASFDLNYTLDTFSSIYVMILGCRFLEPELISFLGGYSDVKLVRADVGGATLFVKDAGKYNSGYYLFDSTPFGSKDEPVKEGIASFSVVYPEGRTRTFYNVTATQNVFSQAKKTSSSPSTEKTKNTHRSGMGR